MPVPARAAISTVEQVRPAAPMSWMPTTTPGDFMTSRHASSSCLSVNGAPTCTVGRLDADSESKRPTVQVGEPLTEKQPLAAGPGGLKSPGGGAGIGK